MSRASVEKLLDLWMSDAQFRAKLRRDPEKVVRDSGAQLSAEEWEALRRVNWSLPDEELRARANKL